MPLLLRFLTQILQRVVFMYSWCWKCCGLFALINNDPLEVKRAENLKRNTKSFSFGMFTFKSALIYFLFLFTNCFKFIYKWNECWNQFRFSNFHLKFFSSFSLWFCTNKKWFTFSRDQTFNNKQCVSGSYALSYALIF